MPGRRTKPLTLQPVFDLSKKAMAEAMSFLEGAGGVHGGGARAATTAQDVEEEIRRLTAASDAPPSPAPTPAGEATADRYSATQRARVAAVEEEIRKQRDAIDRIAARITPDTPAEERFDQDLDLEDIERRIQAMMTEAELAAADGTRPSSSSSSGGRTKSPPPPSSAASSTRVLASSSAHNKSSRRGARSATSASASVYMNRLPADVDSRKQQQQQRPTAQSRSAGESEHAKKKERADRVATARQNASSAAQRRRRQRRALGAKGQAATRTMMNSDHVHQIAGSGKVRIQRGRLA